ncbi:TIGR02678 family protein [Amycolatopsis sp. YIM 10]|uniref:TIGR02678 family protein n=1 Tax=Amycolatopsis sp. YIM 10 TaxID=2653857 RepID=UPI00129002A7|nr:TIGR02678 family protein [Amycolatopsis sp. YIM 10]QFU86982.1 hypothetical protein YIM_08860 [Amycolatopsis sp. YIM 10]
MTAPGTDEDEFRRGVRTLLMRPLLVGTAGDGPAITLVHRHESALREWFDRNLGWRLIVNRDIVRLFKVPEHWPVSPADVPSQARCVLYCLVLAVLEDCGEQTVISELAEKVALLAATREGTLRYDADRFRSRQDLVAVLRMLIEQGVLSPTRESSATERDEDSFVHGDGNALYDVNHRAAALVLSSPVAPSRAGTPDRLTIQPVPDTPEARNRRRRHMIERYLVDTPAMYFAELPDDVVDYFQAQRFQLRKQLELATGGVVEVREEGAALIDDELTDLGFPRERTAPFAALAFADALAREPGVPASSHVPGHRLDTIAEDVTERVLAVSKSIGGRPVSTATVRTTALEILTMLRLVEPDGDGVTVLPLLGRYRNPAVSTVRPEAAMREETDDDR